MRIISLGRICSGKRHAWYETNMGFKIRKPIGDYINNISYRFEFPKIKEENGKELPIVKNKGWFKRLIDWIRLFFFSEEK